MADIHKLIVEHGVDKVRSSRDPALQYQLDLALDIVSQAEVTQAFAYPGFCFVYLPHRRLKDNDTMWHRKFGDVEMVVEPGTSIYDRTRRCGVPYGGQARMILLTLQSEAVRNNSRFIELGRSRNAWLTRLGHTNGGKSYQMLSDQTDRIASCKITFSISRNGSNQFLQNSIIDGGHFTAFDPHDTDSREWNGTLVLSETFFHAVRENPIVIREEAIRLLAGSSMAIDIYIWLSHVLVRLRQNELITWNALFQQFRGQYDEKNQKDWRKPFLVNLEKALMVYEGARVTKRTNGLMLHPSPSPLETTARIYQINLYKGAAFQNAPATSTSQRPAPLLAKSTAPSILPPRKSGD